MGTIIKLQESGQSYTGRIKSCGEVAGNFGAQVKFDFENGDTLFLPKDSADRQLQRIPLGYAECVGEALTFSRDPNPKAGAKPYWGIRLADIVDRAQPAQPKRLSYQEAAKPAPSRGALPFDEESFPSEEYGQSVHAPESPYDNPGPIPPFHKPTAAASVAPNAEKKAAYINAYIDLLGYVKAHSGLKDEVAIQAATATLHIGLKQEGLR